MRIALDVHINMPCHVFFFEIPYSVNPHPQWIPVRSGTYYSNTNFRFEVHYNNIEKARPVLVSYLNYITKISWCCEKDFFVPLLKKRGNDVVAACMNLSDKSFYTFMSYNYQNETIQNTTIYFSPSTTEKQFEKNLLRVLVNNKKPFNAILSVSRDHLVNRIKEVYPCLSVLF